LRWAHRKKLNGRRLLECNPLEDVEKPRVGRQKSPIAEPSRYIHLIKTADDIDPTGRFGLALALARFTGRRLSEIQRLNYGDILLTESSVRDAVAEASSPVVPLDAYKRWKYG